MEGFQKLTKFLQFNRERSLHIMKVWESSDIIIFIRKD